MCCKTYRLPTVWTQLNFATIPDMNFIIGMFRLDFCQQLRLYTGSKEMVATRFFIGIE